MVSTEPEHVGPELSSSARPSLILTEAKDDISCWDYRDAFLPHFKMLLEVPDMQYWSVYGCASHAFGWQRKGKGKSSISLPLPTKEKSTHAKTGLWWVNLG